MATLLRLHVDLLLNPGRDLELPAGAVRHVQVRRLQPGDTVRLFDGRGHESEAHIVNMGRNSAAVRIGAPMAVVPELPRRVTLAVGVPANERMDTLVEKATELGVARIQPLITERSVLRLSGERAQRRVLHWRGIACAAAEQCGRATVPEVSPWVSLSEWLSSDQGLAPARARWVLSPLAIPEQALHHKAPVDAGLLCVLSGPEGGLTLAEEQFAQGHGFERVGLGPRVLRADTAPLAAMAWLSLQP